MKHLYIKDNIVREIIPDYDPIFPNIPINQRYSQEFLSECVAVEDATEVQIGWIKTEDGFEPAPIPEPEPIPCPEPEPEPYYDVQADMAELLIDLAYRTTLLELGVSI